MTESKKGPSVSEGHVHHLFGFALGMVAGANAARRLFTREQPEFEDMPEGYVIAGTKLDALAGDAFLSSKGQWFLLELKNSHASLRHELRKERVGLFRANMQLLAAQSQWASVLKKAETAHQFLYLARAKSLFVPELVTLAYLEWLQRSQEKLDWASRSEPFTSFLFSAGDRVPGFTRTELAKYVWLLNQSDINAGGSLEHMQERIAVAVDATGRATVITYVDLLRELQRQFPQQAHKPNEREGSEIER